MEEKELGIVIKQLDYDDYDQIVTIFTETEIIIFIALGVRKMTSKNRVALQLGNVIEVELFRARLKNKMSKLKRANMVKQLPVQSLDTALVWLGILKYISRIDKPSPKFFRSIIESHSYWGSEMNHHIKTYVLFNFLHTRGTFPTHEKCIECGRYDRINGFEFYRGGFTCINHSKKERSIEYLKAIQSLFKSFKDYLTTNSYTNKNIFNELVAFINET